MRKKMARKLRLAKRVLAFCFALVFVCSCLMPALANGIATYENYYSVVGDFDDFLIEGEDDGIGTQELDDEGISLQIGGDDLLMPMLGEDGSNTTPSTGGATRVETDAMGNKVYIWDNADKIDVSNPVASMPDADHPMDPGFAIPTNTYRFWLSEMDQFDFENITYDAMAAKMGETEYLKMFGEYKGLFHIMHVADGGWLGHNTFADPTNGDDPLNQNRYFGGWYYYDDIGLKQDFSFDEFVWASAETATTYDVFARWLTQDELYRSWYKAIMACSENDVETLAEYYENYVLNDGFVAWAEANLTEAELEALGAKFAQLDTLDENANSVGFTYTLTNASLYYVSYLPNESKDSILAKMKEISAPDAVGDADGVVEGTIKAENYREKGKNVNRSWLFFVKPKPGYVLVKAGSGGYDAYGRNNIYNLDAKASPNYEANYKEAASGNKYRYSADIVKKAENEGYVAIFGFSSYNNWSDSGDLTYDICAEAKKPGMEVEVTSSKINGVVEGDKVTITATITPKNVFPTESGIGYTGASTMSNLKIDQIEINNTVYTKGWTAPKTNDDGKTYTVTMEYTVTKEDCEKQTIPVSITATATYTADIPARNTIETTATAEDTATTYLTIAPKAGVTYTSYVAAGCTVPETERPAEVTNQSYNPVDSEKYYEGKNVTVKNTAAQAGTATDGKDRTYPGKKVYANGGVWTFDGWYYMNGTSKVKAGDTVKMPGETLNFFGEWSFQKTTTTVTLTKKVTGMMAQREKLFDFNVSFTGNGIDTTGIQYSVNGGTAQNFDPNQSLSLKHNDTLTFTNVPIGATITVVEADYSADKYEASYTVNSGTKTPGRTATTTVSEAATTINFINNCSANPNTGVLLDTLPYLLILAVVAGGAAVLMARKRRHHDD